MRRISAGVTLSLWLAASFSYAETVELVTYYPAPGGENVDARRLHADRATVGDPYSIADPADVDLPNGTLLVGGSVGIGPDFGGALPAQALEVQGSVLANPPPGDPALFMADRGTAASQNGLQLLTNGIAQWTVGSPADGTEHFRIFSNADNLTRLLVEQGTGNIGIGTETPNSRLDVRGSMALGVTVVTASMPLTEAHNVILTNGAGNITVTLPAATNRSGRTYTLKKTDGDADTVTINAAGGALIDGAASLVLYVQGDAVRVTTDGFNWFVISDELRPHRAKMTRNTIQNIPGGTYEKILFNNTEFDIGGIADSTTNRRFNIARSGTYLITAYWYCVNAINHQSLIYKNGGLVHNSAGSGAQAVPIVALLDLTAGDRIEMYVYNGSSADTNTAANGAPNMSIVEQR